MLKLQNQGRATVMWIIFDTDVPKATGFQGGLEISLRCVISDGFYFTGRQSKK